MSTIHANTYMHTWAGCLEMISIARQQRSMLMRDIDIANLSVCPSVRNVPVSDENGLTYRHSFFTIRYPNHSSFTSIKHFHEIPMGR